MEDRLQVLTTYWQDQQSWARQKEDQRATMTNYILVIAGAALGFLGQHGLDVSMLAVTVPLGFLGLYGAVGSLKFYERFRLHMWQALCVADLMNDVVGLPHYDDLLKDSRKSHSAKWHRVQRLRLVYVWISLQLAIFAVGAVLTVVLLVRV